MNNEEYFVNFKPIPLIKLHHQSHLEVMKSEKKSRIDSYWRYYFNERR